MRNEKARNALDSIAPLIGTEIGLGAWFTIDQPSVDGFAEITHDRQFIHVDPARAAAGPFGGTVAHGYFTLALLPHLADLQADRRLSVPHLSSVNYGLDKVRFIAPVRIPSDIRLRTVLKSADAKAPDVLRLVYTHVIEIRDSARPALAAEAITLLYL